MSKNTTPGDRARKAQEAVEEQAAKARNTVRRAQRVAIAAEQRNQNILMMREAKELKREKSLPNHVIAQKMGISESTVRTLLMMKED